jgi:uncharacterized protein
MTNGSSEQNTWAMLCHLTAFSGLIGIPFGHILGPLIVWLVKKDQYPLVDQNGKESLNFQISVSIYGIVVALLCFVVVGFFLIPILVIFWIVYMILGSIAANKGEVYRYPLTIRLVQ